MAQITKHNIKLLAPDDLASRLAPFLAAQGFDVTRGPSAADVAALLRERAATPWPRWPKRRAIFYLRRPSVSAGDLAAQGHAAEIRAALEEIAGAFATLDWTRDAIGASIKAAAVRHSLKAGQVMMPLRWLTTGTSHTAARSTRCSRCWAATRPARGWRRGLQQSRSTAREAPRAGIVTTIPL